MEVIAALRAAGCVAAEEEAADLLAEASSESHLEQLLAERVVGVPLAWVLGHTAFCGQKIGVDRGVYVPRWQSEQLARRAIELLPEDGLAIDLATGSGAIACVLKAARPSARVIGTDNDELAVACARRNGVEALFGDLDSSLPSDLQGRVDVITSVPPYVPTNALPFLARDSRDFEPNGSLDGGADGLDVVRRVVGLAPRWLKVQGALLIEVSGEQIDAVAATALRDGFAGLEEIEDEDGDVRGVVFHR